MSLMTLYHGTDIESAKDICQGSGIDVKLGGEHVDFGQGFYTTDSYEKAESWAKRKSRARNKKPAIVIISFDYDEAQNVIKAFADDLEWGRFVINNRNGLTYIKKVAFKENNLDAKYHITYGRMADLDVIDMAEELNENGSMLISIDNLLNMEYPKQVVFHTQESLKYIKKIYYRTL